MNVANDGFQRRPAFGPSDTVGRPISIWPRPFVPSSMGATSTVSGVCDVAGENGGDSLRTVELGSDGLLLPLTELSGAQRKRRKVTRQFSLDRADGSRFAG